MQWRLGHRLPRVIKLRSRPHYRYIDSHNEEDKDCYETELELYGDEDEDEDEEAEDGESEGSDEGREDEIPDEEPDEEPAACSSETLINTQLVLPGSKPDIERILRATVKAHVQNWECVRTTHGKKLVVTGYLSVGIEYVARVLEQSMHFAPFEVPFHALFLCSEPVVRAAASVEYLRYDTVDPRSINLAALVGVDAR